MAWYDLDTEELRSYCPDVAEPSDFDLFWQETISSARSRPGPAILDHRPWDGPSQYIDVQDVTFAGFAGDPIKAWYLRPAGVPDPLPCVVEYSAYGCGRGLPTERLAWPNAGFAHLFVDARGQGCEWGSGGATADPHGSGPAAPGFLTRGIEDQHEHYYRRLFTDAVRAVDAVCELPGVDPDRIALTGTSQGGGTALAAAALSPSVAAVMADVPFLCHIRRAATMVDTAPYSELIQYLSIHRDRASAAFDVLSYFDIVNFAKRVTAPAMISLGLMDLQCPPSTIYAAANHLPSEPCLEVYPFNGHEGGDFVQQLTEIRWLAALFAVGAAREA